MKMFRTILLLAAVVVAFHLQAAPGDTAKLSGKVVDSNGKPVADASVECFHLSRRSTVDVQDLRASEHATTGENGAFEFPAPNGFAVILVKKAGFAYGWKTLQSASPGDVGTVTLSAPSSFSGVVVDENDKPVGNAEVIVALAMDRTDTEAGAQPNYIFAQAAKELFSTRTSADGHFQMANFPAGAQANLMVKAPGKVLKVSTATGQGMQFQAHGGQENIKLVTESAASIQGVVVTRDGGTPLGGARIQLESANGGGGLSASAGLVYSGADGVFWINDVPAGSYRVLAIFTNEPVASWVTETVPATVTAGQTLRDVKLEAIKGGVVEVTVITKGDSKGVAGVNVSAYSEGYPANGVTTAEGTLQLRLPPGQFTIFAQKPGLSQAQVQATVTDGVTKQVKLVLPLPSKVAGTLRDSSGSPVAGASVNVYPNYGGNNGQNAKSGADGHYEVTWEKPSWAGAQDQSFYLLARDPEHNLAGVKQVDESAASLDVDMKPGMTITARVQDAKGKAISNANCYVMLQMPNLGFTVSQQTMRVDQQGELRVEGLPLGEHYSVNFSAPGYGSGQQEMTSADRKADHYEFPPTTLKLADRKLAGRVVGSDGKPVAGAQVWIQQGAGQPNGNATTDADGHFAFDAVCEGPITLSANNRQNSGTISAKGGDTNVTIRFGSNNYYTGMNSLTVTGMVYDANGAAAANVDVSVAPSWGPYNNVTTDEKGAFSVNWQAQQGMRGVKYYVLARDARKNQVGMAEINEKSTEATVRMETGISISGTVQDADGNPFPEARVNLNMMTGNMGALVTHEQIKIDSDGTFTIVALPKGQQYMVNISAADHGSSSKNVSKTQSQSNSVVLPPYKLKNADQELAGQVVGPDGKPLEGVQVYTYGNNQPNVNMRTDSDGRFKMKVCSGPINVNAFSQTPLPNGQNYANVQARGGDKNVIVKLGVPQQQRRAASLQPLSLKPQPWSLSAFVAWPAGHKTTAIVLLALQTTALVGAGVFVFLATRKRKT